MQPNSKLCILTLKDHQVNAFFVATLGKNPLIRIRYLIKNAKPELFSPNIRSKIFKVNFKIMQDLQPKRHDYSL